MESFVDFLKDSKKFLFIVGLVVCLACSGALLTQINNLSIYNIIYAYEPCDIEIKVVHPVNNNETMQFIHTTCHYVVPYREEMVPGGPPIVNSLLWIGIVIGGIVFLLASWFLYQDS